MEQETNKLIAYAIVASIISLIIFYFIIKTAVKKALIEAHIINNPVPKTDVIKDYVKETEPSEYQQDLKEKYDKGQITFEDYNKLWNKK